MKGHAGERVELGREVGELGRKVREERSDALSNVVQLRARVT